MSKGILTRDENGTINGWLIPVWNCLEQDWRPDQVYVTTVLPGGRKGPHLHYQRIGRFTCILGNVLIITRDAEDNYHKKWSGQDYDFALVEVPIGTPAAIYNFDEIPAIVLNMPSPAWSPDNQDEWPVEDWNCPV